MNWDGYEIYQDTTFAKIYSKQSGAELKEIHNNIVYLARNPVFGYTQLDLSFPKKEGLENTIKGCIDFCVHEKIPKMVLKTPYHTIAKKFNIKDVVQKDGTIILDLTKDEDELWKALKKKTRQKIRQGEKRGAKYRFAEDDSDFERWWELYTSAVERIGFPSTEHDFAKSVYKEKSISKLFLGAVNSKLACGTLILLSPRSILAWLGASDPVLLDYRSNFLLQWEIIKWSKNNNYEIYDMGGIKLDDPEHGPTFFKSGWGGNVKGYYVFEITFPSVKAKMIKTGRKIVPKSVKTAMRKKFKKQTKE